MSYSKIRYPITVAVFATILGSCSAEQPQSGEMIPMPPSMEEEVSTSAISSPGGIMAEQNGIQLTDQHFEKVRRVHMATQGVNYISFADEMALRSDLIEAFNEDPASLLIHIDTALMQMGGGNSAPPRQQQETRTERTPSAGQQVAAGHYQLRQNLDALSRRNGASSSFTAQMFESPSANQLRNFMANSQLVNQTRTEYYSGKSVFSFCADGRFYYSQNSSMSVGTTSPGSGGYEVANVRTSGQGVASGHWDTYTENGNDAVLMYSSDPEFAGESLNNSGLLALPIAMYQEDLIQIGQRGERARPDMLLRRNRIGGC